MHRRLQKHISDITAITIIVGTVFLSIIGQTHLLLNGIHFTIGAVGYLLIIAVFKYSHWSSSESINRNDTPNRQFRILAIVYMVLFSIATLLASLYSRRPIVYFALAISLCLLIVLQTRRLPRSTSAKMTILAEIVLLHLNLVYSLSLKYYYYFGRVDALVHARHTDAIIETGRTTGIIGIYETFPLWHILSGMTHLLAAPGWEVWHSLSLIGGIIGITVILGCYLLANQLIADTNAPLYCALFVSVSPTVLFYSSYGIPRTAIGALVILVLLLFLKTLNARIVLVLLVLITAIILYHPGTPPFLLALLLILIGLFYFLENQANYWWRYASFSLIAFILVISYWIYNSPALIETLSELIVTPAPERTIRTPSQETPLIDVFARIYYAPVFILLLVGLRNCLDGESRERSMFVVFSAVGFVFFFIVAPGPADLLSMLLNNFSFARWELYVFPFILLLSGYGLSRVVDTDNQLLRLAGIGILILLFVPAILNPLIAPDNPPIETDQRTGYLEESEITSFDTIVESSHQIIYTDHVTATHFSASPHRDRIQTLKYNQTNGTIVQDDDELIIYRESHARERSILINNQYGDRIRITADELDRLELRHNRIYSTDTVKVYE